jgi:hypothetical protein
VVRGAVSETIPDYTRRASHQWPPGGVDRSCDTAWWICWLQIHHLRIASFIYGCRISETSSYGMSQPSNRPSQELELSHVKSPRLCVTNQSTQDMTFENQNEEPVIGVSFGEGRMGSILFKLLHQRRCWRARTSTPNPKYRLLYLYRLFPHCHSFQQCSSLP